MPNVLEWVKKRGKLLGDAVHEPPRADRVLPDSRQADPVDALDELSNLLEPSGAGAGADPKAMSEILARLQQAGAPHVVALVAQYLASPEDKQAERESAWKSLVRFQSRLTQALATSAEVLLRQARTDRSLGAPAAEAAARSLQACRAFAKAGLIHYSSVPGKLWRLAYTLHALAEKAGCADREIRAHSNQKNPDISVTWTVTTVTHELLRLLMLQMSAPDMLAPEQIEIADRVIEHLGADFTLRPPGVADNPFCFDPGGDAPPLRAPEAPAVPDSAARYFGPGSGFDSLERVRKQLAAASEKDIRGYGKDISNAAQVGAVQHLLMFWRATSPHTPPARRPAAGNLQVMHGYGQVWKQISRARRAKGELAFADTEDGAPKAPDTWIVREASGVELGAELAQSSRGWAKCGAVVSLSVPGGSECWVGMVRRMHVAPGGKLHADVAVLSRNPRALSLREVLGQHEDSVFSDTASRQFDVKAVDAIALSDGAEGAQPANFLLPPERWKEGRIYEAQDGERLRYLRGHQAVRRSDEYVHATFEWVSGPA